VHKFHIYLLRRQAVPVLDEIHHAAFERGGSQRARERKAVLPEAALPKILSEEARWPMPESVPAQCPSFGRRPSLSSARIAHVDFQVIWQLRRSELSTRESTVRRSALPSNDAVRVCARLALVRSTRERELRSSIKDQPTKCIEASTATAISVCPFPPTCQT
jgi:hypothetical protein